jgi:hypothetical protein
MQEEFRKMNSAVSDLETLNEMTRSLERSEVRRLGSKLMQARKDIARRLGITDDQIENFRSLRTKIVPHWLMNRVRAELFTVLQLEVQNLEHEIQLHRQTGSDYRNNNLASAEAQLSKAREILSGKIK